MNSERQILNLIAQYTHYIDNGEFEKVGELFNTGKIIAPGNVMEGKQGVVSQLGKNLQIYTDGTPRTAHITTNTALEIEENKNEATAVSYLTILQDDAERGLPLQPILVGRYYDVFRRVGDTWHFSVRELIITLVGDISHHAAPGSVDTNTIEQHG